eukprot:976445-Rhodomonas_salina.8
MAYAWYATSSTGILGACYGTPRSVCYALPGTASPVGYAMPSTDNASLLLHFAVSGTDIAYGTLCSGTDMASAATRRHQQTLLLRSYPSVPTRVLRGVRY